MKFSTKLISLLLAVIMLVSAVPLTAFAADTSSTESVAEVKKPTPAETIKKEMAERIPYTGGTHVNLKPGSQAGVYLEGFLMQEGDFSPMWNLAMAYAHNVTISDSPMDIANKPLVTLKLNWDVNYNSKWFGEGTMTVSGKKLTIDLNGHVINRTDNGTVIHVKDYAVLTIMDSAPTRKNQGFLGEHNIWHSLPGFNAHPISGGVITGGYLKTTKGGGLKIEGHSTVKLYGGTIAGNKAESGSAVFLKEGSTLDMSRGTAQICYNYCAGSSSDGGTIFMNSDCTVIGGYVHNNLVDDYGGGVRAKGDNITIKDVVIYANTAEDYGGGLYIERDWKEQTVNVSGCKIIGNYAGERGGGAYLYDLMMTNMSDCWVENNASKEHGGGICIGKTLGTDLTISGRMIVRNNYKSTKDKMENATDKSNLYIQANKKLTVGNMSYGSEVWIRTGTNAKDYNGVEKPFLAAKTTASKYYFFSDNGGYYVEHQNTDPAGKGYLHMYLQKGKRTEKELKKVTDFSVQQLDEDYKLTSGDRKGLLYTLYKGWFEFNLMSDESLKSISPFYYSDGYFFEDPTVYNPHLASMSINMAVAAFGRSTDAVGDNHYANHFANVKQLLSDIGCNDSNFFANEDYQIKPAYYGEEGKLSTIGVAISQKEIRMKDEVYTLVPVAIRGGSYEVEWASNVTIGSKGEAAGFADAANQVTNCINQYISDYGLKEKVAEGKVKFWVVGYSRAGATANLTSKRLVDAYAYRGNQIFGYTFEAPMGGVKEARTKNEFTGFGTYPTIHNTINDNDFVTLVAPSQMGFMRYGVDHRIGKINSTWYAETNASQKKKMTAQLATINPYYMFEDSWEVAEVNPIKGNIPLVGTDLIQAGIQSGDIPNKEALEDYTFLRWFFERVQADGLLSSNYREAYAKTKPLYYTTSANNPTPNVAYSDSGYNFGYSSKSIQEAVAGLMSLFMGGLSDEQASQLINMVMSSGIALKDGLINWQLALPGVLFYRLGYALDLYYSLLADWDVHSHERNSKEINNLMHTLLDSRDGEPTIWDILDAEQAKTVAEGLPVLIWFLLNYASRDYNTTSKVDSGMWGVGTFINNMSYLISNHYQEVSVAWVRSYDSFYTNDVDSHIIDASTISYTQPTAKYENNVLTLSAEEGSSIFYSTDEGRSWHYYSQPISYRYRPESVQYFSIYRGAKSEIAEITENWVGALFSTGTVWFLVVGVVGIVALSTTAVVVSRKRKKSSNQ